MSAAAKPTILIVEDVPENIDILGTSLGGEYQICIAVDGEEAIKLAHSARPDLILLDVMMAGMDGHHVCRALKGDPATRGIPIIFVTALGSVQDEERGLNLGAIDYLIKPISPPIVRARVRNHINLKLKTDLLESLALLDGRTNIPNRRQFNEAAESEWKRALRSQMPLTVMMVDIDYFKDYNDTYGHGAGDNCLRQVAHALRNEGTYRPGDLVARYGGEEFVALLPDTDREGAKRLAERFRAAVEGLAIPHRGSRAADIVTVSIGFATAIPSPEPGLAELLEEADRQLYQAKSAGRNRACG